MNQIDNKTLLFHDLPAVLYRNNWILISKDFDNIALIPKSEIDDSKNYESLKKNGFFESKISAGTTESDVTLVTLITTSDCNLRCKYCFANSGEKSIIMDEKIAYASVRHAIRNADGRKLTVAFFGGEPTLTQRLIKNVVEFTNKSIKGSNVKGAEFSITTNGVVSESFLDYMIENKFQITLSVDGLPKIQDYQRPLKNGGKSSESVERTIKKLVENKANFKIRSTVTDYSVGFMSKTVEWAHKLGVKQIQFEPISIAGRATLKTKGATFKKPKVDLFLRNLKLAIKKGSQLGVGIVNSSIMNIKNTPHRFCDGNSQNRFAVTFNGDITTCVEVQEKCHPVFNQFTIGKYNEDKDELVFSKNSREHACLPGIKIIVNEKCKTCFAKNICGGGCPVRNYHVTGNSAVVDPYRCKTIREMLTFVYKLLNKSSADNFTAAGDLL